MSRYLLSLGSNCPGAPSMMERAERWLRLTFGAVESSGIYSSKACNGVSPDYLNMVVAVSSSLPPASVVALGKEFERQCGRTPQSKSSGCVEMDVDVIQVDNVILRPDEFTRAYFLRGLSLIPTM